MTNAEKRVFGMIAAGRRSWKQAAGQIGIDQANGYNAERQSGYKTDTRRRDEPRRRWKYRQNSPDSGPALRPVAAPVTRPKKKRIIYPLLYPHSIIEQHHIVV